MSIICTALGCPQLRKRFLSVCKGTLYVKEKNKKSKKKLL
jgi:hypothetical protein